MRTTVTLGDEMMRDRLHSTDNMTQAVYTAVDEFLRRLEKLRAPKGKVEILSNGEIEATEVQKIDAECG